MDSFLHRDQVSTERGQLHTEDLGYSSMTCFAATRSYWNEERFDGTSACLIARRYSDVVNGFGADDRKHDAYFVITGPLARDLDGSARSILLVRAGGTRRATTLELTLDATNYTILSAAEVPEGL